jgi:hypothetical protein
MRIENILVTKYRMQRRPAIPAVLIRPVACDRGDDACRRHPIASPIWVGRSKRKFKLRHCRNFWCGRRESNPHDRSRGILSPLRLPVSPRPLGPNGLNGASNARQARPYIGKACGQLAAPDSAAGARLESHRKIDQFYKLKVWSLSSTL